MGSFSLIKNKFPLSFSRHLDIYPQSDGYSPLPILSYFGFSLYLPIIRNLSPSNTYKEILSLFFKSKNSDTFLKNSLGKFSKNNPMLSEYSSI